MQDCISVVGTARLSRARLAGCCRVVEFRNDCRILFLNQHNLALLANEGHLLLAGGAVHVEQLLLALNAEDVAEECSLPLTAVGARALSFGGIDFDVGAVSWLAAGSRRAGAPSG